MLNVTNKPFMLSVTKKSFVLSVFMLNVVMLSVVMLNVAAPIVLLLILKNSKLVRLWLSSLGKP
jgi:hypothetical protein